MKYASRLPAAGETCSVAICSLDEGEHLVDVASQAVHLGELRLRHVGYGHMDVAAVLRETWSSSRS